MTAVLMVAMSGFAANAWLQPDVPAEAAPLADAGSLAAPEVYKMQGFTNRIDNIIDELRADFVLKVPHGFVNPKTGALQAVDGKQLRIGYQYADVANANLSLTYINTFGAAGAAAWARNVDQYFTIHKVITSGKNDYLVISVEGDMNILDGNPADNVVDGREANLHWYFGYAAGAPNASPAWIPSAATVYPANFRFYQGRVPGYVSGPMIQMQFDAVYWLWSVGQANWGQVLDYGLNGKPAGVLPANSVAVDLTNFGFSSTTRGPAGSVSDSFWYAWVHEDGSLVESVNTAPIHITGVPPTAAYNSAYNVVSKNAPTTAWTLARTPAQEAQGLTDRVGTDGSIDFTDAGGTGYYRLVAWPESHDPATVTNPEAAVKAPNLSYRAADLFDANGAMTSRAAANLWTPGSVYYRYNIDLPDAPNITTPKHGSSTSKNDAVEITGTGTPGHTITLKWKSGDGITDANDPSLTTLVDGDHKGVTDTDIVVDSSGKWKYTYTPSDVFPDGKYTMVALQTEHSSGFDLTSTPSNPDNESSPSRWGVTITIDTVAPDALVFPCLTSPTNDARPKLSGSGVESGARVLVYNGKTQIGEAVVDGAAWSFTPEKDFENGDYTFTVRQMDAAGNLSAPSSPPCALQVATDVPTDGVKAVGAVTHGDPLLTDVEPDNWEIIATSDDDAQILNGTDQVKLKRDTTYEISERLRTSPAPEANTELYAPDGGVECADANDQALPNTIFDPKTAKLTIGLTDRIAEPVNCTITNRTSQISMVTHRVGGVTESPADGWELSASGKHALSFNRDHQVARALPDTYALAATVPDGLSLVGVETLDLSSEACAKTANEPSQAPEDCWKNVSASGGEMKAATKVGTHSVFRIVAATPADLPTLPMTGGLGSYQFYIAAAILLAAAVAGRLISRFRALPSFRNPQK